MKNYSVLTYIMGDYEQVREVLEKDENAEYILVTDNPNIKSDSWNVVLDEELKGCPFDKCLQVRYNPFKYCTTDICIRLDHSIQIKKSLEPFIEYFNKGNYDICLMPHPYRDLFHEEYFAWVKLRGYSYDHAIECMKKFNSLGYNFSYKGLFQMGVSIVRNTEREREFDKQVYNLAKEFGENGEIERIDQIQFSYLMNTNNSDWNVMCISEEIIKSDYMQIYTHGTDTPNMLINYDINKDDMRYVFNKLTKCLYSKDIKWITD